MIRIFFFLLLTPIIIFSCKQKSAGTGSSTGVDTAKYFQVPNYIQKDINEVNNTPFFIYKIDIVNNRKDSSVITKEDFKQLASTFTKTDLNNEDIKKYYSESIFEDQTTKTITINYSTTNKDLEVQSVDVLLKDDGQTIKRILMRKFYNYSDSSIIEQLSWKPAESFQIYRSVQKADNTETSKQTMVVWNPKS